MNSANVLTPVVVVVLLLLQGAMGQHGGCPEPHGLQTYPHEQQCDKFYKVIRSHISFQEHPLTRRDCPLPVVEG
jgi:hypothetical protein